MTPNRSINTARFAGSDPTACGCWSGYVGRYVSADFFWGGKIDVEQKSKFTYTGL